MSQIELNQTSPSVASLERICHAMGVDLSEFFSSRKKKLDKLVIRHGSTRQHVTEWDDAILEYYLPINVLQDLSVLLLTMKPWGKTEWRAAVRTMKELCIVTRGEVKVYVGDEEERLHTGDAVYIDLIHPHKWENLADEEAEVLLINPNFTEVNNLVQDYNRSEGKISSKNTEI